MRNKNISAKQACLQLGDRLGYAFADPRLLTLALTHRSFAADHNERLEFLGDSVLNLAVASMLYKRLPHAAEGELSRIRANLVKQDSLYRIAQKLDLASAISLGDGELRSGGLTRPSILADVLEAVLGAVYLDAGYTVAEALVHRLFADVDVSSNASALEKDAKTVLQEWLQARKYPVPQYKVDSVEGQAHCQLFHVSCGVVDLQILQHGSGNSRRMAEQDAAAKVLQQLADSPSAKKISSKKTFQSASKKQ